MKQAYRYFNDTYRALNYLFIGTREELDTWLRKSHGLKGEAVSIDINWGGGSFTLNNDKGQKYAQFVWLYKFDGDCESLVTLSHECLHTAVTIMSDRGCNMIVGDNSDQLNYLHDAIFRSFLTALLKEIAKESKKESTEEKTDAT